MGESYPSRKGHSPPNSKPKPSLSLSLPGPGRGLGSGREHLRASFGLLMRGNELAELFFNEAFSGSRTDVCCREAGATVWRGSSSKGCL